MKTKQFKKVWMFLMVLSLGGNQALANCADDYQQKAQEVAATAGEGSGKAAFKVGLRVLAGGLGTFIMARGNPDHTSVGVDAAMGLFATAKCISKPVEKVMSHREIVRSQVRALQVVAQLIDESYAETGTQLSSLAQTLRTESRTLAHVVKTLDHDNAFCKVGSDGAVRFLHPVQVREMVEKQR